MSRSKSLETALVLTLAFLVLYLFKPVAVFLYLALAIGLIGVLIKPLAKIIAIGWFKLAEILSYIVSKVVLGVIFFLILFPISMIYRLFRKDPLLLKKEHNSTWVNRDHIFKKEDLIDIW